MSKSLEADVFVEKAELSLFETVVTVRTPAGRFDAACGLVGEVNVTNIAAAVAVGVALEIPLDVIAAGVEAMEPVPGRMELLDEGTPRCVSQIRRHGWMPRMECSYAPVSLLQEAQQRTRLFGPITMTVYSRQVTGRETDTLFHSSQASRFP